MAVNLLEAVTIMSKSDYIDTLRRALGGLPPATVAKTLAYYEQRFIDGLAAGMSEQEIAAGLDDPKKIALTLRTSIHLQTFEQQRNPVNLIRFVVSAIGLAIFNLFMVVPAAVYACLLAAVYIAGLAFYFAGIAITASGLSGANELVLDGPFRQFVSSEDWNGISDKPMQTHISIAEGGIQVFQEPRAEDKHPAPAKAEQAKDADAPDAPDAEVEPDDVQSADVIQRAEALAGSVVHISTDTDSDSRAAQTVIGLGLVFGGVILLLLGLVISRYTLIGLKRYLAMNLSLLKGA